MMLFFDGISAGVQCTNVAYWVKDYESAFETLTQLVAEGWLLQRATIVEGSESLNIPVEAFDGQPIQIHIRALQRQWQYLLFRQPTPTHTLLKEQFLNWYTQLDVYYYDLITYLVKMITLLEIAQAKLTDAKDKSLRDHYKLLLSNNRQLYKQTLVHRKKNKQQLDKLVNGPNES